MAPTEIEVWDVGQNAWIKEEIKPADFQRSFLNIREDAASEVYILGCASDDSQTTIYRCDDFTGYVSIGENLRVIEPGPEGLKFFKGLKRGESFKMHLTDELGNKVKIRISHK